MRRPQRAATERFVEETRMGTTPEASAHSPIRWRSTPRPRNSAR